MTIALAVGDRSVNTCNDICVSGACSCGVTCKSSAEVYAVRSDVINFILENDYKGQKSKQKRNQSNFAYHHGSKHGH